jgi:hypothetical protein
MPNPENPVAAGPACPMRSWLSLHLLLLVLNSAHAERDPMADWLASGQLQVVRSGAQSHAA